MQVGTNTQVLGNLTDIGDGKVGQTNGLTLELFADTSSVSHGTNPAP